MLETLDQLVRRTDEDRWLASRFASAQVRGQLIAIYALNYEIARTAETVTQGAIGDIRLAWWREALAEIHAGQPARAHPVLQAHAEVGAPGPLAIWERLVEARGKDLDAAPFTSLDQLESYLDATAGGVMRLALPACGVALEEPFVGAAARAWGLTGLLRAVPHWRARGRSFLPSGATIEQITARAEAAYAHARQLAPRIPAPAFPACGYLAFVPGYLRALKQDRTETPVIARQFTLIAAAATGRI